MHFVIALLKYMENDRRCVPRTTARSGSPQTASAPSGRKEGQGQNKDIEIVYIPEQAMAIQYYVPWRAQMMVADVIHESKIQEQYPELFDFPVGIFSKIVSRDTLVTPGDRLEFYRPLQIDPKEKRRMRAKG